MVRSCPFTWGIRQGLTNLSSFGRHMGCCLLKVVFAADQDLSRINAFALSQTSNKGGQLDNLPLTRKDGNLVGLVWRDSHCDRHFVMSEEKSERAKVMSLVEKHSW